MTLDDMNCFLAPRAAPILHRERIYGSGAVAELKLWQVPAPVRGSTHSLKYSLFYSGAGCRLIGYDNGAGKGDHRHHGDREEVYVFSTVRRLLADFLTDVGNPRGDEL